MNFRTVLFLFFALFTVTLFADIDIEKDYCTIDEHKFYFNEAGDGDEVIVFLHGLMANKEQWSKMMEYFAIRGYHVIVPDMPGYGESKEYPRECYSLDKQVELLRGLLERIGVEKINLAGNSLGGAVALSYTKKYKESVETLALLGGPAGLGKWAPEIIEEFKKGKNPFIPLSIHEFNKELELLFYRAPKLPQEVAAKMVSNYQSQQEKYEYIFNIFSMCLYNFAVDFSADFNIPTLIIWGYDDKIITVKDAVMAKDKIPGSKLIILKKAGHLLMIENPIQTSRAYLKFLKKKS